LVSGNSATSYGGGAYNSTAINCFIANNSATLSGSGNGGGVFLGSYTGCVFSNNFAIGVGGGADNASLTNCLLLFNSSRAGGGVIGGTVVNTTVVSNTATQYSGGVDSSLMLNSVVYFNSAPSGSNYRSGTFKYCCTTPLSSGAGNITNSPQFVNLAVGNYHLVSISPCINAGNNLYVSGTNDLDGNPRIVGGTVDIGCYEYQTPASVISYAWLQQFGLPTDGSADSADTDGDKMSNFTEWKSGTIPTNSASVLQLAPPVFTNSPPGVRVAWQSVSGISYYLQRSSDLSGGFSPIVSNIVGQVGTTSYTDITATNSGPYFYRAGVQ
jgi:hypothetical protein